MPTEKLYWADPFDAAFDAQGARAGTYGERPSIVLSRTVFYPEAGGQLADPGELPLGDAVAVHGAIDLPRRRDHMAQHTAQHALSRALVDVAKAETVSARLGA